MKSRGGATLVGTLKSDDQRKRSGKRVVESTRVGMVVNFEEAVGKLNSDYFFREFTFSSNTFKPTPNAELELADNVIWLDDLLILSQVKERNAPSNTTSDKERRWFEDEILKNATRQIRDTISYLENFPRIEVRNGRGHVFDVATARATHPHKLVVYNPHGLLPADCADKKYHRSKTVGVIHLIHSNAYLGILQTLVTPIEVAEYLSFREGLAEKWGDAVSIVGEKALVGHYLRNLPDEKPSLEFAKYVDQLEQKTNDWDISRIIHLFPERRTTPNSSEESGYKVLRELAKLYRTEMAQFRERFDFSMKKALADELSLPNRFSTSKGCGFVFIPLVRKNLSVRGKLLANFTALNKYDQKLEKCIGLSFIAEGSGDWCDVQWFPLESPWEENPTLQAILQKNYPFRPTRERITERYGLDTSE
jgi:hypothetical protein